MKYNELAKNFWRNSRKILLTISCLLALALGWEGSLFAVTNNTANATPLIGNYYLFGDIGSSGLGNQLQDRAREGAAKTQHKIDKIENPVDKNDKPGREIEKKIEETSNRAAGQADAASKQIKGRAQQDIGRTQSAAQKTGNSISDAAENAVENVKNFFNP